jgi:CheY-like chemotaxis protein
MTVLSMKHRPIAGAGKSDADNWFEASFEAAIGGDSVELPPEIDEPGRLLRVLVTDDHRACADTLCRLVGIWGHDVQRAYDGATGLALAAAYPPDVLLLDILMPDISGIEVAQQIRRQSRLKDCLMIAVSSRTNKNARRQCEKAGIHLFLIKPVDLSNLETLLTLEHAYRLRPRRGATARNVRSIMSPQLTESNSHRPTQLSCRVRQGIVAS